MSPVASIPMKEMNTRLEPRIQAMPAGFSSNLFCKHIAPYLSLQQVELFGRSNKHTKAISGEHLKRVQQASGLTPEAFSQKLTLNKQKYLAQFNLLPTKRKALFYQIFSDISPPEPGEKPLFREEIIWFVQASNQHIIIKALLRSIDGLNNKYASNALKGLLQGTSVQEQIAFLISNREAVLRLALRKESLSLPTSVCLQRTPLTEIPPELLLLVPNIKRLYLGFTRISEIPKEFNPEKLTHLDMTYTRLKTLPDHLSSRYLTPIWISGTPIGNKYLGRLLIAAVITGIISYIFLHHCLGAGLMKSKNGCNDWSWNLFPVNDLSTIFAISAPSTLLFMGLTHSIFHYGLQRAHRYTPPRNEA